MYQVKVNNKFDFKLTRDKSRLIVNDQPGLADVKQLSPSNYNIIHNLNSYNVEVVSLDTLAKTAEIKVNGNTYTVSAKDQFDLLLDQLGMSNADASKVSDLKAPMPGLVLKIFVSEGDVIQKGDNLFILEAMKMENIIKAPADVVVKTIKMKPGDKVEKGQVLMLF